MPVLETHNGYLLWHYIPNRPAAIIFCILFVILTFAHIFFMIRSRLWFCIPFVLGGIFEIIGYIGRVIAYDATGELLPYVLQSVFLLLAPIFFAATLYMTLGRLVRAVGGEQCALIPSKWLTRVFVTADVVSFLIQAGGAGILVKSDSAESSKTGQNVIIGGLIFQLLAFAVFLATTILFHIRFRQSVTRQKAKDISWQSVLMMLYVTCALIIIRNIVRAAEYGMGQDGYLLNHEWIIYVLDGTPMVFVMLAFAWKYPGRLIKSLHRGSAMELQP